MLKKIFLIFFAFLSMTVFAADEDAKEFVFVGYPVLDGKTVKSWDEMCQVVAARSVPGKTCEANGHNCITYDGSYVSTSLDSVRCRGHYGSGDSTIFQASASCVPNIFGNENNFNISFGCYELKKPEPEPDACLLKPEWSGSASDRFIAYNLQASICLDGCLNYGLGVTNCHREQNLCVHQGPFHNIGVSCKASEGGEGTGTEPPEQTDCETGTCPGMVNGTKVCVPCDDSPDPEPDPDPDPDPKEEEGKGGGDEDGENGGNENGNGEEEGENGGNGNGNGEGEGEDNGECDPKKEDCDDKKGGHVIDNCEGEFKYTGEGDALVIAIARYEWERNCELLTRTGDSDEFKTYENSKEQNQNQEGFIWQHIKPQEVDIKGMIRTDDLLGGGSCIQDLTFNVGGHSFAIPFSMMCDFFVYFGYAFQAIGAILALRIAFKGD